MSFFSNKNDKKNKRDEKPHSFFKRKAKSAPSEPDAIYVKKNSPNSREIKGYMRAVPIVLVAFALFTTVCLITGSEVGTFGSFFADFLKGLFSYMAYFIPVLTVIHAIFYFSDVKGGRTLGRVVLSIILLLTLSELAYLIPNFNSELVFDVAKFYEDGKAGIGGGFFGGIIGFALMNVFGKIGVIIFTALVFVLYLVYCFSGKNSSLKKIGLGILRRILNFGARVEREHDEKRQKRKEINEKKKAEALANKGTLGKKAAAELMNDDFFTTRNGISSLEIPQLGIYETKSNAMGESVDNLRSGVETEKPEDISEDESRERSYGDFDEDSGDFVRDTEQSSDGTIFFDVRETSKASAGNANPYGLDDSADDVFTEEFDPYELATNEKYAYKPSSKTKTEARSTSYSENMGNLTPQQLAREKMAREFEERKREEQKRRAEAETRAEALRVAEELRKKEEEERRLEAERIEKERKEKEKARLDEERRRREDAEIISDYSRFGQDNPSFGASFRANNPFRFVDGTSVNTPTTPAATRPSVQTEYTPTPEAQFVPTYSEPVRVNTPETKPADEWQSTARQSTYEGVGIKRDTSAASYIGERENVRGSIASEAQPEAVKSEAVFSTPQEFGNTPKQTESAPEAVRIEPVVSEPSSITLTRTRLEVDEPRRDTKVGLDFSDEDDEDDEDEIGIGEPEEIVEKTEIPKDERNADVESYKGMFDMFKEQDSDEDNKDCEPSSEYDEDEEDEAPFESDEEDEPPFTPTSEDTTLATTQKATEKKPQKKKPDYSRYKFPPIDLLSPPPKENTDEINEEIYQCSEKLISTLDSFGITATVRGVDRGPRITRYSIVPAKGISVTQISKKEDDLACALAATSIRIEAPIPGKSAVGIEVPNKKASIVSLRELIESPYFSSRESKTAVCIGKSVEGETVFGDISDMPHLLIAGATGMGKSVCMNSLITSILYRARPDEVKFIMIDPKMVEFAPYNGIPHLLVPVVTDPKQAAGALDWAVQEMNKRYETIQKLSVRNIDSYNLKVSENPELGEPIPKIIVFIDELNDLMISMRDPVENLITLIAQKARAAGIHLVIGTQRPSVNVITGVIKANIPSRIACKVASNVDSRTILEQIGAERLIGRGDMLYVDGKSPSAKRVQGAYVSESETEKIVEYIKRQVGEASYDEQAIEDIRRAAQKCDKSNDDDDGDFSPGGGDGTGYLRDRKFLASVEMSIKNGSVATSWLQRKMSIGYSKAAQYIDNMEELGIVSEKNGSKPRDILISLQEWHEKLARLTSID